MSDGRDGSCKGGPSFAMTRDGEYDIVENNRISSEPMKNDVRWKRSRIDLQYQIGEKQRRRQRNHCTGIENLSKGNDEGGGDGLMMNHKALRKTETVVIPPEKTKWSATPR